LGASDLELNQITPHRDHDVCCAGKAACSLDRQVAFAAARGLVPSEIPRKVRFILSGFFPNDVLVVATANERIHLAVSILEQQPSLDAFSEKDVACFRNQLNPWTRASS
jgi:hypothetical protein